MTSSQREAFDVNTSSELPAAVNELSGRVIGACVEVHRHLGPGLLESAYEVCLAAELSALGVPFVRQQPLPVVYKGMRLDAGYVLDVVVDNTIILELKAVERLLPIHEAQLVTYLRLAALPLGLLINFNVPVLRTGIKQRANTQGGRLRTPSADDRTRNEDAHDYTSQISAPSASLR
jgi:GxxExxY protein